MIRPLIAITLLVSAPAWAKSAAQPRQSALDLGKAQYDRGRFARSLELFGQAVAQETSASDRNQAYYYQGLALFELGLYYSAYTSFRNVLLTADAGNKGIYDKAIRNTVLITDKLNMVDRIGKALNDLPNGFISPGASAHANYAIGTYFFSQGDDRKAASHLKSVHPESPFYSKALFLLGVVATREKNYSEAISNFG
ncbi:tetratricopeptide repeat protein, partial [bacterium]|nr:tetratricopeptide repeat protein [bacterium]